MNVTWIRGADTFQFTYPTRYFCLGIIGSGKSSWLETLGEHYLDHGATVLDLFGSRRGEALAWLRSDWVTKLDKRVLVLHGQNVDVKCSFETKNVAQLTLKDLERYDILISATPLYVTPSVEFQEINAILDLLYSRLEWRKLVYGIVREAANLFYSRLRVNANQLQSKVEAIYLVRESRQMGLSLGLDSLKQTSVDIDMRILCDFQTVKSLGIFGLPDELEWLYHIIRPEYIRNMPKSQFITLSKTGAIGLGNFREIPWHHQERENILKAVGVKVEKGDVPVLAQDRHTFKTVSDMEHAEIIALYLDERQSMAKIQKLKGRSRATIHAQITDHNAAVERSGFCPKCSRVKGAHTKDHTKKMEITVEV